MTLMLVFLFVCAGVGVLAARVRARQYMLIGAFAVVMTALYVLNDRFM